MSMSGWDAAEEMASRHSGGAGKWLRLKADGDKAVVVFLGQPFAREVCWVDGKCIDYDPSTMRGQKVSARISINVATLGAKEAQIFEMGPVLWSDVLRVKAKYGVDKWAYEITRQGMGMDTVYSILPETQLTPEQMMELAKIPLHNLSASSPTVEAGPTQPHAADDVVPF